MGLLRVWPWPALVMGLVTSLRTFLRTSLWGSLRTSLLSSLLMSLLTGRWFRVRLGPALVAAGVLALLALPGPVAAATFRPESNAAEAAPIPKADAASAAPEQIRIGSYLMALGDFDPA